MKSRKYLYLFLFILVLALLSLVIGGCGSVNQSVTFPQLISQADKYNGKTVTVEAFYISGFEISALAESVSPSNSEAWRIVPNGTLIWVKSGITQELHDNLYRQTDAPSGYPEYFGKLKIVGEFETGGEYGHLDAYRYQIAITSAEMLEWSPPPASASTSNLQIKVVDQSDQPLQGAKVVSEEQPGGQLKVTGLTDANGIVTFNDIKSGNYKFYISGAGYFQQDIKAAVSPGQTTNLTINVTPSG